LFPRRALLLAAGLGTRLRPLTRARAKAAAPVDGEPLVRRTIQWLVAQHVSDLVINLHHKPESITAVVGDGSDLGARVRYSWESPVLGSAGGPRRALPLIDEGTFFLVNADTLTSVDLGAMFEQHRRTGALVTMALIANPRPDKYGGVLLDDDHSVAAFTRRGSPGPSYHFIGPQVVETEAFSALPDGVPAESVMQLYPQLMTARHGAVRGFVCDSVFRDIGTPADLLRTSLELAELDGRAGRPRWGRNPDVAASARVTRSVLWDDVAIERNAVIDECVIADGVRIPTGAAFRRCAIARSGGAPAERGEELHGDLIVAPL
jgi:NDP-sugar pyrophosphorylase family protein